MKFKNQFTPVLFFTPDFRDVLIEEWVSNFRNKRAAKRTYLRSLRYLRKLWKYLDELGREQECAAEWNRICRITKNYAQA